MVIDSRRASHYTNRVGKPCGFHKKLFFFRSVGYLGCHSLYIRLIRLALWRAPGGFLWIAVCMVPLFILCSVECYLQCCFNAIRPPLFLSMTLLFFNFYEHRPPIILNNTSSTTAQSAKSGRCLNIPSVIIMTALIIRTRLIMC